MDSDDILDKIVQFTRPFSDVIHIFLIFQITNKYE